MNFIQFPAERVVEINQAILLNEPGFRGEYDIGRLSGALYTKRNRICRCSVFNVAINVTI